MKVLIGDTIFYVSNWRRDRHFTWSSEPREGLAISRAKGGPSFLSYFKTLSIGPAPGIEPATTRSAVTRSTDWANLAAVKWSVIDSASCWNLFNIFFIILQEHFVYG